ncbi:hypothetical protein D7Z26_04435 [Cohnella endophytica]|uniref:Uncharacterized protein n=1 Tax=Cohnella endophytica TaxID=2419778 RepID=A0A494Y3C4_9BACL|nr:hypothetical protein D7Z26_04435 [Cohnella endophytica]
MLLTDPREVRRGAQVKKCYLQTLERVRRGAQVKKCYLQALEKVRRGMQVKNGYLQFFEKSNNEQASPPTNLHHYPIPHHHKYGIPRLTRRSRTPKIIRLLQKEITCKPQSRACKVNIKIATRHLEEVER